MKTRIILVVMIVVFSSLVGCQQQAKLALNLQLDDEILYRVVTESGKDYAFVQPSKNKSTENQTRNRVEIVFAQKTESIDENGSAVLNITINELKYLGSGPKGKIDFDSSRAKDKSDPLAELVGQSYKIKIRPDGRVQVLHAEAARDVVRAGFADEVAQRLFSDDEIQKRHMVSALIDAGDGAAKKGDIWSTLVASPQGMLQSKSYEKQYTLQEVKNQNGQEIAVITMEAVPSSKRVPNTPSDSKGMGVFTKMFEDTDTYNGRLVLNLSTGQIIRCRESLKAEWVAAQSPEEQTSDKGPDVLTIGFTHLYSIEMIDD